jgi:hypothetical protein
VRRRGRRASLRAERRPQPVWLDWELRDAGEVVVVLFVGAAGADLGAAGGVEVG